ncbi:MAG: SUMF1/EgtB/PvdO family nonheme iron enzyme, partial [Gemmatimonadetes bacterium]|nr:SUMF1/EgtB/PvdO family nonheme iron enzyme [Gemmatimonadota bacterium]
MSGATVPPGEVCVGLTGQLPWLRPKQPPSFKPGGTSEMPARNQRIPWSVPLSIWLAAAAMPGPGPLDAQEAGDAFRDCEVCPLMVVVPAGSFMMGSPSDEEGRYRLEGPQHEVTIGSPLAVGVYEVTFEEWDACVTEGGCGGH